MLTNAVQELQKRKQEITAQINVLTKEAKKLDQAIGLLSTITTTTHDSTKTRGARNLSPAARARISAGMKARWARIKNEKMAQTSTPATKRVMSESSKAKLRASQKARWARIKAEQAKGGKK